MAYTLPEVYDAIRKADSAGDGEAVLRLVAYADKLKAPKVEAAPKKESSIAGDLLAGAVRGAGSIGATLLTPIDAAARAVGVQNDFIGRIDRRQAMDQALGGMGVDTDSLAFGAGKLGAEIAGTMGVGGALARGAAMLPGVARAAPVLDAIGSAGFKAGGLTGARGVGARMLGGGVTGGASAALVNPDDADTGAAIGALLPPALQAAGAAGRAVGGALRSPQKRGGAEIAKALDLNDPQAVQAAIAQLRAAQSLVPGSVPTAAQALQTPQAGILQRVLSDSKGGAALQEQIAAQNAARLAALEGVAPTNPTGFASARQDMGEAIGRYAIPARNAARANTSRLYGEVPQDEAMLYLPELASIRDRYFGPGVFTDRGAVDKAVSTAQKIGTLELPAMQTAKAGKVQGATLSQAIRGLGGISIKDNSGLRGEVSALRGELKNLVRVNGGRSPADIAEAMYEAGYLADNTTESLFDALRAEARGEFSFGMNAGIDDYARAQAERAMGDAPGAQVVPKKVTLQDFEGLRRSIGQEQRAAGMSGNDTAAKALGDMKTALDARIDEVVRGDGAIDENLPLDWADKLTAARGSKRAEVERFGTGPQASIFKRGGDGQPMVQGGEIAAKFWGNRPGLADDVKSFRRLIDDNPRLLGQFRSMVTTEGASTQTAAGNLSSKFVRWVDNTLPGLEAAFDRQEVQALKRIAEDLKRADKAASAGMARGSNTYQNAQNALSLGMLDSPLFQSLAVRAPMPLAVPVQWMRDTARTAKAERMAGLLSDAGLTADALMAGALQPASGGLLSQRASGLLLRSAPLMGGDR
jgi:hypothetical protein